MRRTGSAQVVHDPTVVDRRYTTPHRPLHAVDRRAADAGAAGTAAGRHRRVAGGPEGLRRLVPQALVVVLLAGGTAAFLVHDKAVTLDIDGRPRVLHTFADDVRELLADEGVTIGAHDSVVPAPGTALDDGDEVAVRYAAGGGFPAGRRP